MPEGYQLTDAHFVQYVGATSGANDHQVAIGPVPAGKVWTILAATGYPSVDETQDYWWGIYHDGSVQFLITLPTQIAYLAAAVNGCPAVREGMELKLFPGEYLIFYRDAHTVGSTIAISARIIETDMPLYEYLEPQLVKRMNKLRAEVVQRVAGAAGGGASGGGGRPAGFRGGAPRVK